MLNTPLLLFYRLINGTDFTEMASIPFPGEVKCLIVYQNFLFVGGENSDEQAYAPGVGVGWVRIWNLANTAEAPKHLLTSELLPFTHTRTVTAIEAACTPGADPSQQQHYVITGSEDATIKMWLFQGGEFALHGSFDGHVRDVQCLRLIKDPATGAALNVLFSGSADHTLKVWDLGTRACTATFSAGMQLPMPGGAGTGHKMTVTDLLHFSQGTEHFLISSSLDVNDGVKVWQFNAQANGLALVFQADAVSASGPASASAVQ
jgi:WD40 repeat protein